MDLICRAHMVVEVSQCREEGPSVRVHSFVLPCRQDGYEFYNDRTLVTVFSAPK